MATIMRRLSETEWVALADEQQRPCACDGRLLCLSHYGTLDGGARARARRAAGIADFEGRRY